MSTLKCDSIKSSDGNTDLLTLSNGSVSGVNLGRRNLIINGAMQVAQRGTSAVTSDSSYPVDRFFVLNNTSTGTFSAQQVSESPDGFKNSLKVTVTAADTDLSTTQRLLVSYYVEGNDFVPPAFGTSSAQSITLSFQVRSSLTGTFSGSLQNSAQDRSFPFEYTINSANTWETKSITITGDTTGTWLTDTGVGLRLRFSLGCGSSQQGTANTWASANYFGTSSETPLIGTLNATWQITGVQLEVGSVATPFEHRSYGEELALCQRYYYMHTQGYPKLIGVGLYYLSNQLNTVLNLPTSMRTSPTLDHSTGTDYYRFYRSSASDLFDSFILATPEKNVVQLYQSSKVSGTAGQAGIIQTNNASAYIAFDAEL